MSKDTEYQKVLKALGDLEKAATACRDASKPPAWEWTFSVDVLQKVGQLRDNIQFHKMATPKLVNPGPTPAEIKRRKENEKSPGYREHIKDLNEPHNYYPDSG